MKSELLAIGHTPFAIDSVFVKNYRPEVKAYVDWFGEAEASSSQKEKKMFGEIFNYIGQISNITGAVSGIAALLGVLRLLKAQARLDDRIAVVLKLEAEERSVALPLVMLRRDVSRAELLGRIGMLPMRQKGTRFSIRSMSTSAFMWAVNSVVEGTTDTLVIPVTSEELDQFELL